MNIEKLVLRVGGSSVLVGAVTGVLGVIDHNHTLKVLAGCALGVGVLTGGVPLMLLFAAAFVGNSKKGR